MKNKMQSNNERRVIANGDLRAVTKGNKRTIFGYAALFAPAQTQDMGGWREEVHPNAFDRCLRSSPDVIALFNHSTDSLPLARTTSGTLRLSTDKKGLLYELDTPDTNLGRDLSVLLDRGDVHQSSYGFRCLSDSWRDSPDGPIRTVLDADLFDVSPVVFPATLDTTSGVRALALRSAPADIRAKLTRKNVRDAILDDDDDDDTDDSDDDNECGCNCSACADDDDCEHCSDPTCTEESCADCPSQMRAAHLELIARRLR